MNVVRLADLFCKHRHYKLLSVFLSVGSAVWTESVFCCVQAILQDLFPGVEIPDHDYGKLKEEIEAVSVARKLQVVASQVSKVIQLYETMLVRHGVMLVGPTGSGKTTIYKVRSLIELLCK